MATQERIAVLSLQRLGDVLTANRVTAGLRSSPSVAHVELVHWDVTHQAAALLPGVTALHSLPYAELRHRIQISPLSALAALRTRIQALRSREFDRVVNLSSTHFACMVAPLLTSGSVTGPMLDDHGTYCSSHPAIHYLNVWGVDPASNVFAHQDLYTLASGVPLVPPPDLPFDRDADQRVAASVERLEERPIALHVHSSAPEKDWREPASVTGWRGLAAELRRRFRVPLVVLGDPAHHDDLAAVAAGSGAQVCAWPLRQTAALLRRCRGLISVDTVTIHLAAQVGCPTIVLRQGSARGLAFVPGPRALLVDDARTTAGVGDLMYLTQRHLLQSELPSRIAHSLAQRLHVRHGSVGAFGYLGAEAPSWLPRNPRMQDRDRMENLWRERWHRAWQGDITALIDLRSFGHDPLATRTEAVG